MSLRLVAGQNKVSPVVGLLLFLASGPAIMYSISSVPDVTVIPLWLGPQSLLVGTGCTTRR
jgi:hypothetical protein